MMWKAAIEQGGQIQSVIPGLGSLTLTYVREGMGFEYHAAEGRIVLTCVSGRDVGQSGEIASYEVLQ